MDLPDRERAVGVTNAQLQKKMIAIAVVGSAADSDAVVWQ